MGTDEFLNARQTARWLAVAVRTLEKWRAKGCGPAYHRFGRSIRYRVADLERFAARAKLTCCSSPSSGAHVCAADHPERGGKSQ